MKRAAALLAVGMFIALALVPMGARAQAATGTWVSRITGEGAVDRTYPANFHYDAVLNLRGSGSTLQLTCSDVDINVAGWEDAMQALNSYNSYEVGWTSTGSTITITIVDGGYQLTFPLTATTISGTDWYTDVAYVTNTWTFDLVKRSGSAGVGDFDLGWLQTIAIIFGIIGALLALLAAGLSMPLPDGLAPAGQWPGPVQQPPWQGPMQQPQQQPPPPPPPPQRPQFRPTPWIGAPHLVPEGALPQFTRDQYPPWYDYPQGTHSTTTCQRCGARTLSPFNDGWFCTNALCPGRISNGSQFSEHQWWSPP
jgi:hypothetical protein